MKTNNYSYLKITLLSSLITILSVTNCYSQFDFETFKLNKIIDETSGFEFINSKLITHNDSGGMPRIFIFENFNKNNFNLKIFNINNAINNDWEDMCSDNDFLYIADTGNNFGNRKNLKIYKTNKNFKLVDSISISYNSQYNFDSNYINEYDAEAIVSFGSNLLLFSKNRKNETSNIYKIPKNKKKVLLNSVDAINFGSLITGADYNPEIGLLVMSGYSKNLEKQFLYFVPNFKIPISEDNVFKIKLPYENVQFESVKIISNNEIIMTSENESSGFPFVIKIHIKSGLFNENGAFILDN